MKILDARLVKVEDANEEWVTVDIDIDGVKTSVGRIDPKWDKVKVKAYIESIKPEVLKNAAAQTVFDRTKYID